MSEDKTLSARSDLDSNRNRNNMQGLEYELSARDFHTHTLSPSPKPNVSPKTPENLYVNDGLRF